MELLNRIVRHHVWLVGEIVRRLEGLGDEELDTLVRVSCDNEDGQMTLRSITSRLIGQMDMWICAMSDRAYDWDQERNESVSSMRARLGDVGPAFVSQVERVVAEGRLDDTFVDALCDPPEVFTYGGMIAHVLTFAAYNRTLVVQQLGELGIGDLGFGDPMRWVAEAADRGCPVGQTQPHRAHMTGGRLSQASRSHQPRGGSRRHPVSAVGGPTPGRRCSSACTRHASPGDRRDPAQHHRGAGTGPSSRTEEDLAGTRSGPPASSGSPGVSAARPAAGPRRP